MASHLKYVLCAAMVCGVIGDAWWLLGPGRVEAQGPARGVHPSGTKSAPPADAIDVLGANMACYVCHVTFVTEDLVKTHLKEKIGCIDCHGLSAKHANDENIGATKPDVTFNRRQVDGNCVKCHEGHNVPAKAVIARFNERHLPTAAAPICTDCHGTHKIDRSAGTPH
jgi:hypothetical protein